MAHQLINAYFKIWNKAEYKHEVHSMFILAFYVNDLRLHNLSRLIRIYQSYLSLFSCLSV